MNIRREEKLKYRNVNYEREWTSNVRNEKSEMNLLDLDE